MVLTMVRSAIARLLPKDGFCDEVKHERVVCGSLVAVRVLAGWEIVCPRCKTKYVLK